MFDISSMAGVCMMFLRYVLKTSGGTRSFLRYGSSRLTPLLSLWILVLCLPLQSCGVNCLSLFSSLLMVIRVDKGERSHYDVPIDVVDCIEQWIITFQTPNSISNFK